MNDLLISIIRGVLAFVLAWATVVIVNLSTNMMLTLIFPKLISMTGVPVTTAGRWTDLLLLGFAGTLGALVVVLTARRAPWTHATIFGASAVLIEFIACFSMLSEQPMWYKTLMIATLPPQIFLGAIVAMRIQGRFS